MADPLLTQFAKNRAVPLTGAKSDAALAQFAKNRAMPSFTFNPNVSPAAQAAIDADTARRAAAQAAPMPAGASSPAFAGGAASGVATPTPPVLNMGEARIGHRTSVGVPQPIVATADAPAGVTPPAGTIVRGGIGGGPTLDVPPGTTGYMAGSGAMGVMQARANGGLPGAAPMPPQQQGAPTAPPTLAQRASSISDRVRAGLAALFGETAPAEPAAKQPSAEFLATEKRFSTTPATQTMASRVAANNY